LFEKKTNQLVGHVMKVESMMQTVTEGRIEDNTAAGKSSTMPLNWM